MGRKGGGGGRGPWGEKVRGWAGRRKDRWLPPAPEHQEPRRSKAFRKRRAKAVLERPPAGLQVTAGDPDGWRVALQVRRPHRVGPKLAMVAVLLFLMGWAFWLEPLFAVMPAFGIIAIGVLIALEETGPGEDVGDALSIGSTGLQCGDVRVPAAQIRDVFWAQTVPGEMRLGVRGNAGEFEIARVATDPPFAHGLTAEHRDWIAEAVRAVGRANRGRAGSEADVPDALSEMKDR